MEVQHDLSLRVPNCLGRYSIFADKSLWINSCKIHAYQVLVLVADASCIAEGPPDLSCEYHLQIRDETRILGFDYSVIVVSSFPDSSD